MPNPNPAFESESPMRPSYRTRAIHHSVHELFHEHALATPHSIAVATDDAVLTYEDLNAQSSALANRLRDLGVARGVFVGVCLERSADVAIALLGILKAGGAYVPLDPAYPDERLSFMLCETAARVVIAHQPTASRFACFDGRVQVINIRDRRTTNDLAPALAVEVTETVNAPAYVMYTSGSTGTPKGVVVSHRGIVRLVRDTDYCDFGRDQVFLHYSPPAFDASTFEIWGALLNGARLVMLPPGPATPEALQSAIERFHVTTLWMTAGLFHLAVEQRVKMFNPLQQLLAGGDVLSAAHVRRAVSAMKDGCLINGYGPTECTTFACCHRMTKDNLPDDIVPIGRPIANTSIRVLAEDLHPVPVGQPGELFIGGPGVALGYLNQPELSRERFIPDPLRSDASARLYRTGDRVRQRPDGVIEFLGRFDDQVKISGHRIEPGEIATTLRRHPDVRECAVIVHTSSRSQKQLVAYVVANERLTPEAIRRYLAEKLPNYMVPAHVVMMAALPLTSNGKVDRANLPPPVAHSNCRPSVLASGWEERLTGLLAAILRRPVDVDDNFFDLGATSLDLIEFHGEVTKSLRGELRITQLFASTTIRALAHWLDHNNENEELIPAARRRSQQQRTALLRQRQSAGRRA